MKVSRAFAVAGEWWRRAVGPIEDSPRPPQDEANLRRLVDERGHEVADLQAEARGLEVLTRIGSLLAAEHEVGAVAQVMTEAASELSGAAFGAFFYATIGEDGKTLDLIAVSGDEPDVLVGFGRPRMTAILGPTFHNDEVVRSANIQTDPRFAGHPPVHPKVRSYLAVPVRSRHGAVIGGLLLGDEHVDCFSERTERLVRVLATQGAIAMDSAHLHLAARREIAARAAAEEELAGLNAALEERVAERTEQIEILAAESRRAEEMLRHAQKMEGIGLLTGGVAHDFNNVLQAISGNLEMARAKLRRGGELDADRLGRHVENALSAAGKAALVTQQLLTVARRQRLEPVALDAVKVLQDMDALMGAAVGERIRLEWEVGRGVGLCLADKNQLESAVLNLVNNARDAINEVGGLGTITISIRAVRLTDGASPDLPGGGEYVRIAIRDTGPGMPAKIRGRAFEPFVTTKPPGKGTGLGLAMVYGFARQSNGIAAISDNPFCSGLEVSIALPRIRDDMPVGAGAYGSDGASAAQVPGGCGETILVVEDDQAVRDALVDTLEDLGYRVLQAVDADAGLAAVDAAPDAVLTDMAMPGTIDGMELAILIRQRWPALPVALMTGNIDPATRERLPPGALFLAKPYRREDIAHTLRRMLGMVASV